MVDCGSQGTASCSPGMGNFVNVYEFKGLKSKRLFSVKSRNPGINFNWVYRLGSNYALRYRFMSRYAPKYERTGDEGFTDRRCMTSARKTSERTAHVDKFLDALCEAQLYFQGF